MYLVESFEWITTFNPPNNFSKKLRLLFPLCNGGNRFKDTNYLAHIIHVVILVGSIKSHYNEPEDCVIAVVSRPPGGAWKCFII